MAVHDDLKRAMRRDGVPTLEDVDQAFSIPYSSLRRYRQEEEAETIRRTRDLDRWCAGELRLVRETPAGPFRVVEGPGRNADEARFRELQAVDAYRLAVEAELQAREDAVRAKEAAVSALEQRAQLARMVLAELEAATARHRRLVELPEDDATLDREATMEELKTRAERAEAEVHRLREELARARLRAEVRNRKAETKNREVFSGGAVDSVATALQRGGSGTHGGPMDTSSLMKSALEAKKDPRLTEDGERTKHAGHRWPVGLLEDVRRLAQETGMDATTILIGAVRAAVPKRTATE